MNEEDPIPNGADSAGITVLWLLLAFLPSLITLPFVTGNSAPRFSPGMLLVVAAACCLGSAFGVLRKMKEPVVRIVLAIFLAGAFFVLNVFIVLFIGCSGMGRIAP